MSCYGWEHGTFTLPSADAAQVRAALRTLNNTIHDEVRAAAIALHRSVSTTSHSRYQQALYDQRDAASQAQTSRHGRMGYRIPTETELRAAFIDAMARAVIDWMLRDTAAQGKAPRQPQVADVTHVIPRLTNKDNIFRLYGRDGYGEGSIVFDGRTVTYSVPENNHAVDRANESPIGQEFFRLLGAVRWTRGTGGYTTGNDEYNENESGYGRRGDYLCRAYGPLGTAAQVHEYVTRGFSRAQAARMVTGR